MGPSLETGLDSFPSGHASASFAVAAALARNFPRAGRLLYSLAALIAISRIVRGSHFPTDVLMGVVLGMLIGSVVAHPIRSWKNALSFALINSVPYLVAAFGLIWIAVHPGSHQATSLQTVLLSGIVITMTGVALRIYRRIRLPGSMSLRHRHGALAANGLIGVGLALTTGSGLVTMLAISVSIVVWLAGSDPIPLTNLGSQASAAAAEPWREKFWVEIRMIVGIAVTVLAIHTLRGLLPILW
jgi:undecaprenyl-diphosphatase